MFVCVNIQMFVNIASSVRNFHQLKILSPTASLAGVSGLVQIDDVAFLEVVLKLVEQLQLLFGLQTVNHIKKLLRRSHANEAGNVHVHKCRHQELTVETIHNSTVSGNHVSKVLNLECSLEPRREESSERSNHGAEDAQRQRVQHERVHRDRGRPNAVLLRPEQIARFALDGHPAGALRVLDRTHKVLELAQPVGKQQSKHHSGKSTPDEALPGLLGAQLDERRPPKEEPKHVRHHVIAHNHRNRHDKPNQPFENVLNDEVALGDHNQQRHVGPRKQAELLHVVALHERQHEPNEPDDVQTERQEPMVLD